MSAAAAPDAQRIFADRDKRSLRTNRDFYRLQRPQGAGYAVRNLARSDLLAVLEDPAAPLAAPDAEKIKESEISSVVKTHLSLDGHVTPVAYKRAATSCGARLCSACCAAVARCGPGTWDMPCANGASIRRGPCWCASRTAGWLRWESYLATEWVDGDHLHEYAQRVASLPAASRTNQTRMTAVVLGRMLGRMHAWNIGHRDLKAQNLLLAEQAGRLRAYLIDLDGVRLVKRLSQRRRARNLARLATSMEAHAWVTRTDRLRFLRLPPGRPARRPVMEMVLAARRGPQSFAHEPDARQRPRCAVNGAGESPARGILSTEIAIRIRACNTDQTRPAPAAATAIGPR